MLLSRAGLELAVAAGFSPDILHCHDWHAAPAVVMLRGAYRDERVFRQTYTVLTIHNIGYQGVFSDGVLEASDHGELRKLFAAEDLAADQINFLKAGIMHADALTTVSPTHAREIQTPEYGKGLDELLRQKRHRLAGILNGVDYGRWSPESDALLPARYSAQDPGGKRLVREALLRELHLQAAPDVPVVGLVSRLAEQKGIDLLIAALPALLRERNLRLRLSREWRAGVRRRSAGAGTGISRPDRARRSPGRAACAPGAVWQRHRPGAVALRALRADATLCAALRHDARRARDRRTRRYGPAFRSGDGGRAPAACSSTPTPGGVGWGLRTALDWFADRAVWAQLMRNGMRQIFPGRTRGRSTRNCSRGSVPEERLNVRPASTASRRQRAASAESICDQSKRQVQLPLAVPGVFMRASLPSPSRSCIGIMARRAGDA